LERAGKGSDPLLPDELDEVDLLHELFLVVSLQLFSFVALPSALASLAAAGTSKFAKHVGDEVDFELFAPLELLDNLSFDDL
jgi:hypothetical protein